MFGRRDDTAGVEHVRGVGDDQVEVEVVVVGEHDDGVGGRELLGGERRRSSTPPGSAAEATCGSAARTSAPRATSRSATTQRRRLPGVAGVALVRQAEQQDRGCRSPPCGAG